MTKDWHLPQRWEVENALRDLQWAQQDKEYNRLRVQELRRHLTGQPACIDLHFYVWEQYFRGLGYREHDTQLLIRTVVLALLAANRL